MTAAPLQTEVVPFVAGDKMPLNLHHVTGSAPTRQPVLVVHGAGVRADIFRPPGQVTLVDRLVEAGYDVWLENWRASIDLPATSWTLDQAAVYDHPAAVRAVLEHTGAKSVDAVVHCQGSTSFTLSAVAGLLPDVRTIVSNAVSLHPVIPPVSNVKIRLATPVVRRVSRDLNPAWAFDAPTAFAKALVAAVRLSHHECDNDVCRMVSFTYGIGFPCLWSHDNITDRTHDWISNEFASVPLTFFEQMARSVARGHLVCDSGLPDLPPSAVAEAPQTDARFVLLAGANNRCFLPDSQAATFAYLDAHRPGRHALHIVPGYGHLDMFFGRNADRDVFPLILEELDQP